ncbi:hypothetical protein F4805DRAFT_316289 [Annulohypoxylon moriforme]|nr:hypothetical protein F4805DRAFT_316289 [Annulohypoxylon moriforme]
MEQAKPRRTPPSVRKHIASVNQAIGGRPSKDASKEEWDVYLDKFMTENNRQSHEDAEKSWVQYRKAKAFVDKMGQRPFQALDNDSDEDEGIVSTKPAKQKGQTERGEAAPKNGLTKNVQKAKPAGKNEQRVPTADEKETAEFMNELAENRVSTQSPTGASQAEPGTKPKRRRTGPESLRSSLGKNWEAMVDEEGHRPARRAKKQ